MKNNISFGLTILFVLAFSILATIYLAWLFYPLEISWQHLETAVSMKGDKIQHNFNILMEYLTNPFQKTLTMPDFPSSQSALHHFEQVKWLFHLVQLLTIVSLPALFFFLKNVLFKGFGLIYRPLLKIVALAPFILLALAFVLGFDRFFTLFHQVLFVGDSSWLFNPNTDPVITILPENFFLHCFLLFFILYECCLFSLLWKMPPPKSKH